MGEGPIILMLFGLLLVVMCVGAWWSGRQQRRRDAERRRENDRLMRDWARAHLFGTVPPRWLDDDPDGPT